MLFVLLVLTWMQVVRAEAPLVVAVHPYLKYGTLVRRYTPLADYDFLGGHGNVALAELAGDFDARVVTEEVISSHRERGLEAVAFTPVFSEPLFVTRGNLDWATIRILCHTLHSLSE